MTSNGDHKTISGTTFYMTICEKVVKAPTSETRSSRSHEKEISSPPMTQFRKANTKCQRSSTKCPTVVHEIHDYRRNRDRRSKKNSPSNRILSAVFTPDSSAIFVFSFYILYQPNEDDEPLSPIQANTECLLRGRAPSRFVQ